MVASHGEGCKVDSRLRYVKNVPIYICTRRSGGTAHEDGGATSQLDLPSLTPLSVAGCGRLQPGVPHWATLVDYCK